ncbi:hypothetical protein AB0D32_13745 [Micromonospora sp. NPDC048170]|uniref:hypothetical protein n=1 Tax=Micromonospora sp. NPDC048170 TaxID=3154819 RepID=UPI0033F8DE5E
MNNLWDLSYLHNRVGWPGHGDFAASAAGCGCQLQAGMNGDHGFVVNVAPRTQICGIHAVSYVLVVKAP